MSGKGEELLCMLLQTAAGRLLVPRSALCEVVPYSDPVQVNGVPEWLLGTLRWSGHTVPVVSFESMNGAPLPTVGTRTRIAVLTGLARVLDPPCIALLVQDHPLPVRPGEDSLAAQAGEFPETVQAGVTLDGEPVLIPDLAFIERSVSDTLSKIAP